jgi:hypothetical protein
MAELECVRYLFATQPSSFIKNNINFRSVALRPSLSIGLPNFIYRTIILSKYIKIKYIMLKFRKWENNYSEVAT